MHFTKMQGLGNDFICLDCTETRPEDLPELARKLTDRHFGVGGDGLICLCPSEAADFAMHIFNADGSEGETCGNGLRCIAKLAFDRRLITRSIMTIETLAGVKLLSLHLKNGSVETVTVDMGVPELPPEITVTVKGKHYTVVPVSMGNPHAVIFADDLEGLDLAALGPCFEHDPAFPDRTNTEFVTVQDPAHLRMRVWERGSGETLACGSGACAALAASVASGRSKRAVTAQLLGGDLGLYWDEQDGHIYMTGPAVTVFEGQI
ncbi:MAG: diaminopimelate epimerase [Pseudoflavonifractor sp.]